MITLGLNGIIAAIILFGGYTVGVYEYGTHHQATVDNVKDLEIVNQQQRAEINLLNFNNMKLQNQNILTSSVMMQDESQLADLQVKYTNSLVENQRDKTALNNSNRINLFWLQHAEGYSDNGTTPGISLSSSKIDATSQYITPSSASDGINEQLNVCREDIINFIALQRWINETATNYNGKTK